MYIQQFYTKIPKFGQVVGKIKFSSSIPAKYLLFIAMPCRKLSQRNSIANLKGPGSKRQKITVYEKENKENHAIDVCTQVTCHNDLWLKHIILEVPGHALRISMYS